MLIEYTCIYENKIKDIAETIQNILFMQDFRLLKLIDLNNDII